MRRTKESYIEEIKRKMNVVTSIFQDEIEDMGYPELDIKYEGDTLYTLNTITPKGVICDLSIEDTNIGTKELPFEVLPNNVIYSLFHITDDYYRNR